MSVADAGSGQGGGLSASGASGLAYLNADARLGAIDNGKLSLTIDAAASQLIRGEPGWSAALGIPATITYAYRASAPAVMPEDASGFQRFNTAQISAAELALKAWSDVANIHFLRIGFGASGETAYSNSAAILFGDYTAGVAGAAAFGMMPGSTAAAEPAGDVWINSTFSYNASPAPGNYGATVLLHELGHAIGLAHPADYDAAANAAITYSGDAAYYEDSRQYTVMSYFSEANTGASFMGYYPTTPMLDDIAAAQLEYGPNMATRTGDTVYGFHSNADAPWFIASSAAAKLVVAIWDAGGRDTLDFSGYFQNQLIDLRQGFFSNVGGLVGNVAIAKGAVIENAIGGAGDDLLQGNDAGDQLIGGAGGDTLSAGAGGNTLRGGEGADSIVGGAGFNDINGNTGADTIVGASTVGDWLLGGQNDDRITNLGVHAVINGNLGDDTLYGGARGDILRGGQGADVIVGGAGGDWISGDRGDDTLTGGAGADTFRAGPGAGLDLIVDFNVGEGDRIQLDPGTAYAISQSGPDAVITLGSSLDRFVLAGVQSTSLPPGFILFA